jgi:hypothetical protein
MDFDCAAGPIVVQRSASTGIFAMMLVVRVKARHPTCLRREAGAQPGARPLAHYTSVQLPSAPAYACFRRDSTATALKKGQRCTRSSW